MRKYVEQGTSITYQGKKYTAGGAVVTSKVLIAYLDKGGVLTNWKGAKLGTYRIVSSWRTPRSYVSDRMYQVEATVEGVTYTGRSAGVGMLFKGKRKAGK